MFRFCTTLLALGLLYAANAQVYHSCPLYQQGEYENPLYEEWLSAFDVKYYHLSLDVSNTDTHIAGAAEIMVEAMRDMDTLVLELQDGLEVSAVSILPSGSSLDYQHSNQAIYIKLDRSYQRGEACSVEISYEGLAGNERGFFAGISNRKDSNYGFDVTYTLSEPHNARDWFPVKQVLEDKIDSFTFTLVCDKGLLAGSNGILMDVEENDNKHSLTWETHYPTAYYLISFAVADYMDYSFHAPLSEEGDSVLVQNYLYNTEEVMSDWKEQIDETGAMINLFSLLLGDYPFAGEKYGHAMAPMGGGMEHQTMTTIHNFNFSLVAHELAHQWFGDYITCGNWQDIWINEGFASYMEYVAAEYLRDQGAADDWMDNAMSIALGEPVGSVYVPAEEVEDTYRLFSFSLSYKKGAVLLHLIRFILDNDELFYDVLSTYLRTYQNGLATGADFQTILEEVSGVDFSCFFEQWYYGEGYPIFKLFWEQDGDSLVLRSEQTGTAANVTPLFQVPFELEIIMSNGQSQYVRLDQQSNEDEFSVHVEGMVERIVFDPDNHLLKTATVIQKNPEDEPYWFGPNPVTSKLSVQFPNLAIIDEVGITNYAGQEIYRETDAVNPLILDLSKLADGAYLLELTIASDTYQERIVKISPK